MKRDDAIATLRRLLPTIRRDFGVRRIALFGSTARDEARDDSDLDILVDFEGHLAFLSYMGLRAFLADTLGRRVDLVTPDALKPRMLPTVERDAVDVGQGRNATGGSTRMTSWRPAPRFVTSSRG
jgi:predicted nucleotidyltransferase